MSAFECNITPTRFRKEQKRNEDREPTFVDLRPFSGKSIVTFDDVPVSKSAQRLIIICNPFDEVLKVSVTKQPKSELNATLEWLINKIAPQSQKNLLIVWNPLKVVACREVIQISDENGNKKDISVIFKSCELRKVSKRMGPASFPKRLKMKTPSPPQTFVRSMSTPKSTKTSTSTFKECQENQAVQTMKSPLRNTTNQRAQETRTQDLLDRINFSTCLNKIVDKENNIPDTPKSASVLFDNIRFTPLTETKPKCESKLEYLSSLPTPVGAQREDIVLTDRTTRRNLMEAGISPEMTTSSRQMSSQQSTSQYRECQRTIPTIEYQLMKETTIHCKTFVTLDDKIEDEINEIELVFEDHRSMLGHTRVISTTPLCVISEDEQLVSVRSEFHKTFEVNKSQSLTNIEAAEDSPARLVSESMQEIFPKPQIDDVQKLRANQGSMPNLNEINDQFGSIEHNRYYRMKQSEHHQQNVSIESIVSNADFRETEICAQSSRYNLNELGSPSNHDTSKTDSPFKSKMRKSVILEDSPSRRNQASINSSPTMRRIHQEPEFKSPPKKVSQKMTFSPPARSKLSTDVRMMHERETLDVPSSGRMIRATTWKQQQNQQMFVIPKVPRDLNLRPSSLISQSLNSLSSSSLASVGSTCSTPACLTKGRLYNENHLNVYNRKDPFSATTTNDPFLSSTMYLDELTLDNIEKTYKKWLNALVTIPPDLESDKNEKIDVGKLFNDVQTKELALAPTKEAVCSRYYTSRLDTLRTAAVHFFHSEAISTPLNKLTVMINEKNKLDIKADRNIHLDLVLQRNLLELLLCYNPLWLRIGIEVVFNVQLNLTSNHDIYGMSRFIITSMFKSQYLAEKYSKFSQQKEYLEKLRKFTVKNFLFMLFFLDRAKESRLIKQNPCLFVKKAPYKESNEILKKFASLVLANYGDIIRMLRRFEYTLTHKQTVIDEFDYAFKNLAVDLRDGVRLTKVMEIILMRDDLVQKVRVPAISRLQKVYNVDLALKALEAADYQILGKITSKDIADGHREKTLSLLWQIIYKFRAPRFNAAAITLQKFWRTKYLLVVINKRIKAKEDAKLNRAATFIQKYYRGWKSRQAIKVYREKVTKSCIIIQKNIKAFISRRRYQKKVKSALCIQQWFRRTIVVKDIRTQFKLQRRSAIVVQKWWRRQLLVRKLLAASTVIKTIKRDVLIRHQSAAVIQRSIKSFVIRKKFHAIIGGVVRHNRKVHLKNLSAMKIQRFWRGFTEMKIKQQELKLLKTAAITTQRQFRAKLEMNKARLNYKAKRAAVVIIQKRWKATLEMRHQREEFRQIVEKVTWVQRRVRANQSMKIEKAKFILQKRAVITIQSWFRAILAKRMKEKEILKLNQAALIIQKFYRGSKSRQVTKAYREKATASCITIQKHFKAFVVRRQYKIKVMTTICVQRWYRRTILTRKIRSNFEIIKRSTINVQQRFRANQMRKVQLKEFVHLKNVAVLIQRKYRAKVAMKLQRNIFLKTKAATIILQQKWRSRTEMRKQRHEFQNLKQVTINTQRRFRANKLMTVKRDEFLHQKTAAIKIQRFYRGFKSMKVQRKQFAILKTVVIAVQQRFRATSSMRNQRKSFLNRKRAAIKIQQSWRNFRAMQLQQKQFKRLKMATLKIQQRFRAYQDMKKVQFDYSTKRAASIKIQQFWRSVIKMRHQREEYRQTVKKIVWIQQLVRANQSMKVEKAKFDLQKINVILIQRFWRGFKITKSKQEEFKQFKTAAIKIQQKFRANLEMKKTRFAYTAKRAAAVKIQQHWKATLKMRQQREIYRKIFEKVTWIQRRVRANQSMKVEKVKFAVQKSAVVSIQRQWRGFLTMKNQRNEFCRLRTTAIKVQQRYRAKIEMKNSRSVFLTKRKAVQKIQQFWRATLEMRKRKEEYRLTIMRVVWIQRRFRANQWMKIEKAKFESQKNAAIEIQRFWRGFTEMKIKEEEFQLLKKATVTIQRQFRAKIEMNKARLNYKAKRAAAVIIQKRWKATFEMRQQREEYRQIVEKVTWIQRRIRANQSMKIQKEQFTSQKKAAISVQRFWRGLMEMRSKREEFNRLKIVTIKIQQRIRAKLEMNKVRAAYTMQRVASIKIQQFWRSVIKMRIQKEEYRKTVEKVVWIQRRFRAKQSMKFEQEKFSSLKRSTVKIQRWFRSFQLMVVERNQYLQLKKTVLLVENRILANKIMQIERENFVQLRQVIVYVQRRFRSKVETRKCHQQFKNTRLVVVKLQSRIRGHLARRQFREMQTPERLELRQKHKAARSIQAAWRGYQERSKNCNRHFKGIVERLIKATKNVDPAQTLGWKLKTSIDFLKESYDSNVAISFLAKLEYMARTVPWILIDDAEFVSLFCYGLMAQAIRSEVDKQIIELCSCIILDLSRYKDTKENAFQEFGLKTISQMLLRWCDKDCGIFNSLCTLVWVFAHCEKKKKIIREFILMKDGEFIVSQIKQNVLRKENMRKNSRRPIGFQSISLVKYKKDYQMQLRFQPNSTVYSSGFITPSMMQQCREMPSLQPDYGVVKTMPYIFYSSVFAFDNVLAMLGIN